MEDHLYSIKPIASYASPDHFFTFQGKRNLSLPRTSANRPPREYNNGNGYDNNNNNNNTTKDMQLRSRA